MFFSKETQNDIRCCCICITVKISRMKTQINGNDSIINSYTDITLQRDAPFAVDPRFQSDAVVSITDLHSLAPGRIVHVKCYVSKTYEPTMHQTRNGDLEKQNVIIADNANSIKLVLYGNDVIALQEEKSYILRNSSKDIVYLNTTLTQKFSFEEIDGIEHINDASVVTDQTIMCKIKGVSSVILNYNCIKCYKKMQSADEDKGSVITSNQCNSKMINSNCRITSSLSIIVTEIQENTNISFFLANDQSFQLKEIINFPLNENDLVKALPEFPDIFQVEYDISSKVASSIQKV